MARALDLVATGRQGEQQQQGAMRRGRWSADEKIPMAGFNMGRFSLATAQVDGIRVASYSAGVVEEPLPPLAAAELAAQSEQRNHAIAQQSAEAIARYQQWFGSYPYSSLALTQMPGASSQGWPTLVYLSSYAYLTDQEREVLKLSPFERQIYMGFMLDHEIAHQWWGDRVGWQGYRDQWLMEALANLSALMILEEKSPARAAELLEHYRRELLATNAAGKRFADAGPVTLGYRLSSSVFPNAYIPVTYGRGLWLMVMLRDYFLQMEQAAGHAAPASEGGGFLAALREFGRRYQRGTATTDDFRHVLEDFLPAGAGFQGERSLGWFFDEWVRGDSVPQIQLKQVTLKRRGALTIASFELDQQQCPESLITSVPIFAELAGGKTPIRA